jgi:hypothetical protein
MPRPYTDTELLDFLTQQAALANLRIEAPSVYVKDWRFAENNMDCEHAFSIEDAEAIGRGASLREALSAALARSEAGHA